MQMCGRYFSAHDIDWIRDQVDRLPDLTRIQLSRLFCQNAGWTKPDGGLKEMSCRVAMLRLERAGLIRLPKPRTRPAPVKTIGRTVHGEPRPPVVIDAGAPLAIVPVERNTSALWNELIDRYHYLGYRRMGGAQMRFFVHAGGQCVALLGFSAAAWRVAPRDAFIGWSQAQRKANLHLVVDNSRFLILPWIQSRNLASRILARAARMLPDAWQTRYRYRPVLLETFVETPRFTGTCYQAANWTCVGRTLGRGKWDRRHAADKPVKTVWLYPLQRRSTEALCR
jgi:hypothetical protein